MTFTPNEIAYLNSQRLGRLATTDAHGAPHNVPVGFRYNPALGTIEIGGHGLGASRKFHHVQREPRVSFVVDDLESVSPWKPRFIEIRGKAEALAYGGEAFGPGYSPELIRIYPRRIISWGIDEGHHARNVTP
jgi:pyridoxamine 5'-phosphate oxidase family protein